MLRACANVMQSNECTNKQMTHGVLTGITSSFIRFSSTCMATESGFDDGKVLRVGADASCKYMASVSVQRKGNDASKDGHNAMNYKLALNS